MADFTLTQGMTKPILADQLTYDDDSHPNLTGKEVKLATTISDGWVRDAVIDDAVTAEIHWVPQSSDSRNVRPGTYFANWIVIDGEDEEPFPSHGYFTIEIQARLGGGQNPLPFLPSTREVARSFLMARTADTFGNLIGDFTEKTSVTADQASIAIANAAEEVAEIVGNNPPADTIQSAKRLTILLASANIEMSYFPDQASTADSIYEKLMARYNSLKSVVSEDVSGDEAVIAHTETSVTGGHFPVYRGWETRRW